MAAPIERHTFLPSRPGGTVCVNIRSYDTALNETEVCGFPAGHPIHESTGAGVAGDELTARQHAEILRPWVRQMPGGGSQHLDQLLDMAEARTGVSDRTAAALLDVAKLREEYAPWRGNASPWVVEAFDIIEQALRAQSGGAA